MNYLIVEFPSAKDLEKGVNNLVSKGFKPIGGVNVTAIGSERLYSQAMWSDAGFKANAKWGIENG